jgi:hypothetical protein
MKRINIDVSKGELDYLREALEHKHINLMSYLNVCEESTWPTEKDIEGITEEEIKQELKSISKSLKTKAPYGRKKDGTPKKRPGRKVELL